MMLCQHVLLLLLVLAMLLPLSESPSSAERIELSFICRLSRNRQYSCGPSSACKQKTQLSFG